MPKNRVLVAWIGHTDLAAMADDLPEPERVRMLDKAGIRGKYGDKPGPLKTAVEHEEFDEIHLLSNYDTAVHVPFKRWLGGRTTIHPVELTNPTDYFYSRRNLTFLCFFFQVLSCDALATLFLLTW